MRRPSYRAASADPPCLVVSAYGSDHQHFWSGRRWVVDPSDAQEYTFRDARKALRGRLTYREANAVAEASPGARDLVVVEAYGTTAERVAMSSANGLV